MNWKAFGWIFWKRGVKLEACKKKRHCHAIARNDADEKHATASSNQQKAIRFSDGFLLIILIIEILILVAASSGTVTL